MINDELLTLRKNLAKTSAQCYTPTGIHSRDDLRQPPVEAYCASGQGASEHRSRLMFAIAAPWRRALDMELPRLQRATTRATQREHQSQRTAAGLKKRRKLTLHSLSRLLQQFCCQHPLAHTVFIA